MCSFRLLDLEKAFGQNVHVNCLSSVWIFPCLESSQELKNALGHTSHLNGLIPECTFRCAFNLLARENTLAQSWHVYGFSLVCTVKCSVRLLDRRNARSQNSQWNFFSPVCILVCRVRSHELKKSFITGVALVRFLSCMCLDMTQKVCRARVRFLAKVTFKRLGNVWVLGLLDKHKTFKEFVHFQDFAFGFQHSAKRCFFIYLHHDGRIPEFQ